MTYILIALLSAAAIVSISADYWSDRIALINFDESEAIGTNLKLSDKELLVNKILMHHKLQELDEAFQHPEKFLPAINFFQSRSRIEESEVFKFIKKLPKGSSLHSHDIALASGEYVYNLTHREHLFGCVKSGRLYLKFFPQGVSDHSCAWNLVSQLRQGNETFDDFLKTQINIISNNPGKDYPAINDVWTRFQETFATVGPMLCYVPVFKDYFYQALKELYEDNVMYLEFRGTLPPVYNSQGETLRPEEIVALYIEVLEKFKHDYPDFHGARFIYAPNRNVGNSTILRYAQTALALKEKYPDFIAGFDLVGQEDRGEPLKEFIPQLMEIGSKLKFFFHAGETNWNGMTTDLNLVDAVLLNTTRIGHGYDILKHPGVLKTAYQRGIALEVSPISNQVLKLVDDMRNHPASILMNHGFKIVICCDDPSFWGAKGLSYDWYMAYMGMASRKSDLRFLKQLAINSILYSAMEAQEKEAAMAAWSTKWDAFLTDILKQSFFKFPHYNVKNV